MNNAVKTFALSSISIALLSGCLFEQKYEPPVNDPETTANLNLYGNRSDARFQLTVMDENGNESPVSDSGDVESLNIRTEAIGNWESGEEGHVLVSIRDNQPAAIMTSSQDPVDISSFMNNSTVQFSIFPMTQPLDGKTVTLSTKRPNGVESSIDLTTVINAFAGAREDQIIKVPVHCFKGIDPHQMNTPFMLSSESDFNFKMGDISIKSNSVNEEQVLTCSPEGTLITEAVSNVFTMLNGESKGWAREVIADKDVVAEMTDSGIHVSYFGKKPLSGGIRLSTIPEQQPEMSNDYFKDLGLFMEKGELQFDLTVDSFGQHPTGQFQIEMESRTGAKTPVHTFHLPMPETGTAQTIRIPVKELLTLTDGTVAINSVQNLNTPLYLQPEPVGPENTLNGMEYTINSVQLLMNPSE